MHTSYYKYSFPRICDEKEKKQATGCGKTALIYVNILSWNTKQGMGDWGRTPDTGKPGTAANYRCQGHTYLGATTL